MTIRVYPSALEGEPIEVHETEMALSVAAWIKSVAPSYSPDAEGSHPTIRINGEIVEPEDWAQTLFGPDDNVDVYIEARGIAAIISVGLSIISIAMTLAMKPGAQNNRRQNTIEDPGLYANQVRWGDPVPEIAGSPVSFPDYIVPPRRYYQDKTEQVFESLVCIGVGEYQKDVSQVFVGESSAPTLGDDFEITFFEPGETIPAPYNEWWHTTEEVGVTQQAGAGMTLGAETFVQPGWTQTFTLTGQTVVGNGIVPPSWEPGMSVQLLAEHEVTFDGNSIRSALLSTFGLGVGDGIQLTGANAGTYVISSVTPGGGGSPGTPATVTGSAPPSRLDFGVTPAELTISFGGSNYVISLTADEPTVGDLVATMNSQLNAVALEVTEEGGGELLIAQTAPFGGESISVSGDVSDLMGSPAESNGTASTPSEDDKYHISGANFGTGSEIIAAGVPRFIYTIVSISGNTLTITPPDVAFWDGFPEGMSDATSFITLDPGSRSGGWVGPFTAVPRGEEANAIEVDIFYPQGLIHYTSKGYWRPKTSNGTIAWRLLGTGTWFEQPFSHTETTPDQIGFTHRINVGQPGRYEVRVKTNPVTEDMRKQWTGLRARITGAPTSYPGWTTAHIRMRSGDKVSAASENKVSVRAMRVLPTPDDPEVTAPTRDIVPFFIHMMATVGYGRDLLDMPKLQALHDVWSVRGDTFDLAVNSASTLKTVANYCLNAGFAELTLHRGKISAARDAHQSGQPGRIYSPQEMTAPLVETTESIMPDDIDGVDAEYVDYLTGRTLTASYRLAGDLGLRVESIKVPGVTSHVNAWRIAARRRRIEAYRRTMYRGSTELAAMNSYYWDHVGLQDGIPEYGQSAFVVDQVGENEFILSEPVKFESSEILVRVRRPDGTAAPAVDATHDGYHVTLDSLPLDVTISSDPNAPTVFYLGENLGIYHPAIITAVTPDGDSQVSFEAVGYDDRVYVEDDDEP